VGQRVLRELRGQWRVRALTSQADSAAALRRLGVLPLQGDLDDPASLRRLAALASRVLHLAPPPLAGRDDPRTRALLRSLGRSKAVSRLVYGSTTGVYGNAAGARFDETRPVAPDTDRAHRRVDAERALRRWALARQAVQPTSVTLLRIPGIYALDRPGGDPRERLRRGSPVLAGEADPYTNHIHADDLARACRLALLRGRPQRVLHVCDHSDSRMGDHFEQVARLSGLPLPPRLTWEEAVQVLSPVQLSFLSESRRLVSRRLEQELRLRLRYPTVEFTLRGVG
jgi:nucleoside-diphosphate-sugar epimerase